MMRLEIISKMPKGDSRQTPVLFVHGAWHGAWCWESHFLPYFAENGYCAYALSLRGHGESERPRFFRWMRITDYVADLAEAVEQLPEQPILVGHSMGGLVVQKYLEANPAPAAVLLASVPIKGVLRTTLRIACRHPYAFLKANLTWSLYPLVASPELTREAFFSKEFPSEMLAEYFGRMQDESYLAFIDMLLFQLPDPEKVTTQMLILCAENDIIFHPDEVEETARAYNTRATIFPGMAHDMMIEKKWEKVADQILAWLGEKGL